MRKLLHIGLALLLLISTSGIIGSRHLCGNRLVSIELFHTETSEDCCSKKADSCCNDVPVDCCDDNLVEIEPLTINVTTPGIFSISSPKFTALQLTLPTTSQEVSGTFILNNPLSPYFAEKEQHKRQSEFGCLII